MGLQRVRHDLAAEQQQQNYDITIRTVVFQLTIMCQSS